MLNQHDVAPLFSSLDQEGQVISLSDYLGKKNVVLYFYPKDDTPGCTIEANDFTALAAQFAEAETVIIGVSKDSCQSHRDFIGKFNLNLLLLADTSGELCETFGVWQEVEKDGQKIMKLVRSTFVIDKKGVLAEALYGVSPAGHAQAILEKVQALNL